MKKAETKRAKSIKFEQNDVMAYGNDIIPMWCADNITNGCSQIPSTSNCTSCAMKNGCQDAFMKTMCGFTSGCADGARV